MLAPSIACLRYGLIFVFETVCTFLLAQSCARNESQVSEIGQSHLPLQIDNPIELKSKRKMSQRKSVLKGKKRKSTLSKNNKLEGDFE